MTNKTWFTADTHFGHERTMELSKRPFKTTDQMDADIIRNWNINVGENDTVYHLGDFGDYNVRQFLNGHIVLLYGNYERADEKENPYLAEHLVEYHGFDLVIRDDYMHRAFDYMSFNLVHEPSKTDPNIFNLFGHIHKLQMVKRNGLNVGVDCHNFTPIDLDTVKFYRNAIENHYDEEVFGSLPTSGEYDVICRVCDKAIGKSHLNMSHAECSDCYERRFSHE